MTEFISLLQKQFVIRLDEATKILGNEKAVYRLVDKGELVKVLPDGLGLFTLPEIEEGTAQFAAVAKYYKQCVVSGKTALSLYDLSLDYIREIDVDISNKTNLLNDLLNVHRVVDSKICSVIEKRFEDKGIPFEIRIYSPERVLFEAYKYYKGTDSYLYALSKYRELHLDKANPGIQFDSILKINRKVGHEMINLLQMGSMNE